jgi:GNAT superfamily N-acetyltransferase
MPSKAHPLITVPAPGMQFVSRLTSGHIEQLWRMYQNEWWSHDRKLHDVGRVVQNSDLVFAFCDADTGSLVAFARVLTDFVYKAVVFDVIVARSHRDLGLGRMLLDAITTHPALLFVENLELYCRDEMVPFYQKWGFTTCLPALRCMRKTQRPLLASAAMPRASHVELTDSAFPGGHHDALAAVVTRMPSREHRAIRKASVAAKAHD